MMNGYRRAAMRLRSLGTADRAWLLDQLLPEERGRIAALLEELDALDPDLEVEALSDLVQEHPASSGPESSPPRGPTAAVAQARADMIARVLADEPDWLVARVCAIEHWPWLPDYLTAYPARAARIRALMRDAPSARRSLERALVAAVAARLQESAPQNGFDGLLASEQRGKAGLGVLSSRLARWLR